MERIYRDRYGITQIHLASFRNGHVRVVFEGILTSSYAEKMKVGCIAIVEIEVNHRLIPLEKCDDEYGSRISCIAYMKPCC